MAPTAPPRSPQMSHRAKALARLADPTLPRKVHRHDNAVTDAFLQSKRDKKLIRRSAFRAQVEERRQDLLQATGRSSKVQKRRRPSKKRSLTLESLAAALPEIMGEIANAKTEGILDAKQRRARASLRSRPGVLKRKETLVKAEMRRFGSNLAQLALTSEGQFLGRVDSGLGSEEKLRNDPQPPDCQPQATTKVATANRFALLREFISATMEQNPAFADGNSQETHERTSSHKQ